MLGSGIFEADLSGGNLPGGDAVRVRRFPTPGAPRRRRRIEADHARRVSTTVGVCDGAPTGDDAVSSIWLNACSVWALSEPMPPGLRLHGV